MVKKAQPNKIYGDGPNPSGICMCGCGGRTPISKQSDRKLGYVAGTPRNYILGHNQRVRKLDGYAERAVVETPPNPTGLCMCGCGGSTSLAKSSSRRRGWIRGHPVQFIRGHHARGIRGADSHSWKGRDQFVSHLGYVVLLGQRGHPHAYGKGEDRVLEHVDLAYRALGKPLPPGTEVHHVNGIRSDNSPGNLVICQDHAYHFLLHKRARAIAARTTSGESA